MSTVWTQITPVMDIDIVYEFTSHISEATVLTPLTLVPSCAKIMEQSLWTLNNMNKNHRRTRENARVQRHESSLEDNPSQRVWREEGAIGERMSTLKYMLGINVIAVSNTQKIAVKSR